MPHDELKPKDRVVLRMTRDGAVEENLTEGTSEKVSKRLEDAQLVAPHDAETGDLTEEVRKRRQLRPDELEDAESQAQAETQSADAVQEYKPGDLPVSDDPTSYTLHSETYRTHSVDYGKAFADTAVTGKVSRPRAERQIDGESVLERAAETSAEMPDLDGDAPASRRIERLERKSQKAHERLDAAREKLPTKKVLKKERVFDEKTGKGKTRLYFEDEVKVPKGQSKLQFEADKTVRKVGDAPASRRIERLERKSQKAHERLDAAREKLPTKKVLKKERVFDEKTGKGKTRLYFEDEVKVPKGQSKLQFEADKTVRKVGDTLASGIHGKIHEVEQENSGVEAAHKTEIAAESVVRHYQHHTERSANKPFEKVSKLEQKAEAADRKLHFEKTVAENPEMKTSRANMNKHYQKQHIKKEYAAARKAGTQTASTTTKSTGKTIRAKASDKVKDFIAKNKKVFAWLGAGLMILILLSAGISSCTAMFTSTTSSVIATSYLSEDDAMTGAEAQYCQMEAELQSYLDNYESTHDYDEYHFDLDAIEHDPYVLISILSAFNEGEFTLDEVQGLLQTLFDRQYILTEDVEVEVRYRTETRTGTTTVTDPETGETSTETYTYEVEVPYNYYICTVTLENFDLSHLPVYIMNEDQLSMYSAYMSTLGNREDLFPGSGYVDKYIENPPDDYTVNAAYLTDEKFATLIAEAEKYLGYPYVWGGSNPSTSFDCSGFVSYVLTNSGLVNTGRLGAQGLYNVCSPVSSADVKPGDLVFFVGTYDTPGVSHVGIYVGDNVMLHCGDPIQYTSINTSYWQSHFYAFGRPNY